MMAGLGLSILLTLSMQTNVEVGVHIPKAFFASTDAKARFLSGVEQGLGKALEQPVRAQYRNTPKALLEDDIWIVDAEAYALIAGAKDSVVASARTQSQLSVYLRKGHRWKNALEVLQNGKVSVPGSAGASQRWFRYWIMLDDPAVAPLSTRLKVVRDVRTALSAVEAGKADAALVPDADYQSLSSRLPNVERGVAFKAAVAPLMVVHDRKRGSGQSATAQSLSELILRLGKSTLDPLPTAPPLLLGWQKGLVEQASSLVESVKQRRGPFPLAVPAPDLGPVSVDLFELLMPPPKVAPPDVTLLMEPPTEGALIDPIDVLPEQ